jgi:hypothetical protein
MKVARDMWEVVQMASAVTLYALRQKEGVPWDPREDGFDCSRRASYFKKRRRQGIRTVQQVLRAVAGKLTPGLSFRMPVIQDLLLARRIS